MGGERFDQAVPESYLFGENADLNWLGSKPISVRNFFSLFTSLILYQDFPFDSSHSFHICHRKTVSPQRHWRVSSTFERSLWSLWKPTEKRKDTILKWVKFCANSDRQCKLKFVPFLVRVRCWYEVCNKNLLFLYWRDYDEQYYLLAARHNNDVGNVLLSKRAESGVFAAGSHLSAKQICGRWYAV